MLLAAAGACAPKPTPSVYHLAMKLAGSKSAESCIFVEDSIKNLVTAKDLGWKTVLVDSDEDHQAAMWRIPSAHYLPEIIDEILN